MKIPNPGSCVILCNHSFAVVQCNSMQMGDLVVGQGPNFFWGGNHQKRVIHRPAAVCRWYTHEARVGPPRYHGALAAAILTVFAAAKLCF